jgi:hypothetical protein
MKRNPEPISFHLFGNVPVVASSLPVAGRLPRPVPQLLQNRRELRAGPCRPLELVEDDDPLDPPRPAVGDEGRRLGPPVDGTLGQGLLERPSRLAQELADLKLRRCLLAEKIDGPLPVEKTAG